LWAGRRSKIWESPVKAKTLGAAVLLLGGLLGALVARIPRAGDPAAVQEGTASGVPGLAPRVSWPEGARSWLAEIVLAAGWQEADTSGGAGAASGTLGQEVLQDRRPVILVPGWMGRRPELAALRERFLRDGWPEWDVLALEFADPVGSNLDHARELEGALELLLAATGAEEVDVVAHSMGGLAVWVLLQEKGGLLPIRRVVFLASPLQGTVVAHLAWGEGGREMRPGSGFLEQLESGGQPQEWVEALTIRTPLDLNVVPGYGATLPGLGDRVICCPTHQGLLDHEEAYRVTRDFLLYGRRGW
jgi:triacylglycerol lipase